MFHKSDPSGDALGISALLENITDAFCLLDKNWRYTCLSRTAEQWLGVPRTELIGRTLWETEPALAGTIVDTELHWAMTERMPVDFRQYDWAKHRWYQTRACPAKGGGLFVFWSDVLEEQQAHQTPREGEQLRLLFEQIPVGMAQLDLSGKYVDVNACFCGLIGYRREELLERTIDDITHPDDQARHGEEFRRLAAGEISRYSFEKRYIRKDGTSVWVEFTCSLLQAEAGAHVQVIGIVQDVTERKKTEAALRRSNEELQQFAYAISHDLREPLRMVTSFGQVLQHRCSSQLDEIGLQALRTVISGGKRLHRMLNDLLVYLQAGAEKQEMLQESVDLQEVLTHVLSTLQASLEESGGNVVHGELPTIRGQATQVEQVLQNLIGNALKYRHPERAPQIEVTAERRGSQWLIRVADNGVGFTPEQADQIFGAFTRLHGKEIAGTGIGLALCKRIVEHHGGRIWAESTPGIGSTFSFLWPSELEKAGALTGISRQSLAAPPRAAEQQIRGEEISNSVLLIGSSPEAHLLLQQQIQRAPGPALEVTEVPSGADGLRRCRDCPPDCVVLDLPLTDMDGQQFLQQLAAYQRVLPVLVLGDSDNAAVIEKYIQWGAHDVFVKGPSTTAAAGRWVRSVLQKVRLAAGQREAEREAQALAKHLETVLESTTDGVVMLDTDWRFVYLNGRARSQLSRERELLGMSYWDAFPETGNSRFGREYRRAVNEQVPVEFEEYLPTSQIWYSVRAYPSKDGLSIFFQDVSERKREERAVLLLSTLVNSSEDAIISKNLEGIITSWNRGAERLFGYTASEIVGQPVTLLMPPDRLEEEPRILDLLRRGEQIDHFETVRQRKDGSLVPISLTISPIRDKEGAIVGISKIARDVTASKQAADALRASEAFTRSLVENSPDCINSLTLDGRLEYLSKPGQRALGIGNVQPYLGRPWADFWQEPYKQEAQQAVETARAGGVGRFEGRFLTLDGRSAWWDVLLAPIPDEQGRPAKLLAISREITERKSAEAEVRRSEQQVRRVLDSLFTFVGILSFEGTLLEVNRAPLEAAGLTKEDVIGQPFWEASWWNYSPQVQAQLREAIGKAQRGERSRYDVEVRMKDGQLMAIDFMLTPMRDDQGHITHLIPSAVPITERKRAEQALQESEERLQYVLRGIDAGVWDWDLRTNQVQFSPRLAEILGYAPEELTSCLEDWVERAHPDDRPAALAAAQAAIDGHTPVYKQERRIRHKDGSWAWVFDRGIVIREATGTAYRMVGSFTDITARKEAEAELARSHEELHASAERVQLALAAGAIVGTWDWELTTDRFTVDERFAESFGIDPALGRTGLSLEQVIATVHPDDLAGLRKAIDEVIARGGAYSHEYRVRGRHGTYRWIEANGRVDLAPDGTPLRFPGVLLDIERRRTLEAERDRATELLRAFTDAVPGAVYAKDHEGRILIANRGVTELIGKPPDFYLGKTDLEFLDDKEQAKAVMANDRRIMESGMTEQIEEKVSFPDGSPAIWLSTKAPFRDAGGRVIGLIGSSIDITVRKQAEQELQESRAELERERTYLKDLIQQLPCGLVLAEAPSGRILVHNEESARLLRHPLLPSEDVSGYAQYGSLHEDGSAYAPEFVPLARAVRGESVREEPMQYRCGDGTITHLLISAGPVRDAQGRQIAAVCTFYSAEELLSKQQKLATSIQRVQAEKELLRTVIEKSPVAMSIVRVPGFVYELLNPAFQALAPGKEMLGRSFAEVWGEVPEPLIETLERVIRTGETYEARDQCYQIQRYPGGALEELIVSYSLIPLRGAEGAPDRIITVAVDTTKHKQSQDGLQRALHLLSESEKRLRYVLEGIDVGVWDWDLRTNQVQFSSRWSEMLGDSPQDVFGSVEDWSGRVHPEDLPQAWADIEAAREGRTPLYQNQHRLRHRNGSWVWVLDRGIVIRDQNGVPCRMVGSHSDITERVQVEQRLRRTNKELEQLAWAASHDLHEPMRMVFTFTQLLDRQIGANLDERARHSFIQVHEGARRMQSLITGLRQYWEANKADQQRPERVDASIVLKEVLESLEKKIRESGAVVTQAPLPVLFTSRARLLQTFYHLIHNSLQFHHPGSPPTIHVSAEQQGFQWVFAVRDEGIGISPQHHQHIFGFFKRLDRSRPEGAGLGLALAVQAVACLGGRLWVESELACGATFHFTVPVMGESPEGIVKGEEVVWSTA